MRRLNSRSMISNTTLSKYQLWSAPHSRLASVPHLCRQQQITAVQQLVMLPPFSSASAWLGSGLHAVSGGRVRQRRSNPLAPRPRRLAPHPTPPHVRRAVRAANHTAARADPKASARSAPGPPSWPSKPGPQWFGPRPRPPGAQSLRPLPNHRLPSPHRTRAGSAGPCHG